MKSGFMSQRDEAPEWGEDLSESVWLAVTDQGRKIRFTLAPQVSEEFALRYAQNHRSEFSLWMPTPVQAQDEGLRPETILSVEKQS